MATILVEILGNGRQFKSELASVERSLARASGGFGKFAKVAAGAGVVLAGGVAFGLKKSIDAAGDFQESLNVMRATTGASAAKMKEASAAAIKLGADIHLPAVSAKDAADAMLELGRDGFTAQQSMDAARGTLLLVTAAQTDTATAAKIVTQNIHAFGLGAKNTSAIVDQMAGFMNTTGTSFDAFADSLTYTAAISHTVGQSFADNAAQLAILSQKGIEGSQAGTGLRTILSSLGNEGSKASGMLKKLGISTIDQNGRFIGMHATLQRLQPVLAGMTASQRLMFLQQAFGKPAMNAANILLSEQATAYDKTKAAIERKGQADQLAASHMKGYNGAMAQLSSALETLEIEVGLKLLPIATRFALWLTAELPVATKAAQDAITFLTPYFEMVKSVVADVISTVRAHWSQISSIVKTANDLVRAELATLSPYFERVRAVVSEVMTAIGPIVRRGWQDVQTIFEGAKTVILEVMRVTWEPMKTIVIGVMNSIKESVQLATNVIVGVIRIFDDVLHGEWGKAWGALKNLVSDVLSGVSSLVHTMLGTLATAAGQLAVNIVKEIGRGARAALPSVLAFFGSIPGAIVGALGDVSSLLYNAGVAIIQGLYNGISSKVQDVYNLVGGIAGKISSLKGPIEYDRVLLVPHGQAIMEGLLAGMASRSDALVKLAGGLAGKVADALKTAVDARSSSFQSAWSSLTSGADAAFSGLKGGVQTPAEKELSDLQSARDEASRQKALTDAQTQLDTASAAGDAAAILSAQQQLADAKYAIQVASLQKQADTERIQLDARNTLQQSHFDAALTALQNHLAKGHDTYAEAQKAILNLFKTFGVDYASAGADLGTAFVKGLGDSIASASNRAGAITDGTTGVGGAISGAAGGRGVSIIVNGWVGDDDALANKIQNVLVRKGRNTTGGVLGSF